VNSPFGPSARRPHFRSTHTMWGTGCSMYGPMVARASLFWSVSFSGGT
jgi:hypothetical protein